MYIKHGKQLDMMHGLNTYDYGARQYDPILGRWDRIDPMCEKYYSVSPYAYCGNNPMNRIDPDGQDYWSTNDPIQIKAFFNAMGAGYTQFDFSQWNHATDAQFVSSLTYNDETHKFYTSYGEVINGEATIIGKSFDADLTPVSFSGKGYIGAFAFEPYSGFWEQARYYWNGGIEEFGGQSWKVNISGRITGYAPIIGIADDFLPEGGTLKGGRIVQKIGKAIGKMSANRAVQDQEFRAVVSKLKLDQNQARELHDLIHGQGYDYHDILEVAKEFFNK